MGISQEEIVHNAQTVTKGLEALRLEHQSLLGGLKSSQNASDSGNVSHANSQNINEAPGEDGVSTSAMSQAVKCSLLEKSLEMIDLGLGEAYVMSALASHLQVCRSTD